MDIISNTTAKDNLERHDTPKQIRQTPSKGRKTQIGRSKAHTDTDPENGPADTEDNANGQCKGN